MSYKPFLRRLLVGVMTGIALAGIQITVPFVPGAVQTAQAQVNADFQEALAPYGQWIRHQRWGMVWVPEDIPPNWRPYQYGHWVYTEDWGWYWISDPEEEDWGWVVFHYGRWVYERRLGWFWIPDDEWAPAWVDWRYGGEYVGWAPLPPEELIVVYDRDPTYWVFVSPRFLTAPRLGTYFVPPSRRAAAFRGTHIVNRSIGYGRGRAAINPGLSPAFVARATRAALPTYRVTPRVLSRTQGVAGAVAVAPDQLRPAPGAAQRGRRPTANRANAVTVQPTSTTIAPSATAAAPQPLGAGERGRLGSHPPRAAQGGTPPAPPPQQQPQAQPQPTQQPPRPTPPPAAAPPAPPAQQPARPAPPAAAPQPPPPAAGAPPERRLDRRDQRPPGSATPPPPAQIRPARPAAPQPPAPPPPAAQRPAPPPGPAHPPPPAAQRPPAPAAHPAAPAARPQPPAARPAAPPPRPAAPPPAKPAPPPAAKPAPKPDEKKKDEPPK